MDLNLSGKTAIVCGSSQGIGRASAMALAELGASIVLIARNEEALEKVQAELPRNSGQSHRHLVADFSEPELLKEKIRKLLEKQHIIHILVNNTGGPPAGPALSAGEDEFLSALKQHLLCSHVLMQAVVPGMKAEKYGRIINIISTSVKQPIPNLGVSNTTRGAMASWSKTLSRELAPFGITVNNVLPGATLTGRLESLISGKAGKNIKSREEVEQEWLSEIPAARFAHPEEVANAVAFLASPAASYINGVNLPVDGGRLACF